ncbi:hypothetical protein TRVL_08403 [Trypanosoma vivax]|nr:hypothetical protein TRVL_08403 [Trypanosoma vivax]
MAPNHYISQNAVPGCVRLTSCLLMLLVCLICRFVLLSLPASFERQVAIKLSAQPNYHYVPQTRSAAIMHCDALGLRKLKKHHTQNYIIGQIYGSAIGRAMQTGCVVMPRLHGGS